MSELGRTYAVRVEVLSPVHIGCGRFLHEGMDFVVHNNRTYRLNEQAVLDAHWPEDSTEQRKLLSGRLGDLVSGINLGRAPELALYAYAGQPAMGVINEHIKTVFGQAYVPGSSLKGALRTALMRTMREGLNRKGYDRGDIGPAPTSAWERDRAAKNAGARLEKQIAGYDSNHSLFRGLQVSDTTPVAQDRLRLQRVQMRPELDIDVEAIAVGTTMEATLRVDRHTLFAVGGALGFDVQSARTVAAFALAANYTARSRVNQERAHHTAARQQAAADFCGRLGAMLNEQDFDKRAFLIQVGFAAGWRAKTLVGGLPSDNPLIAQIVNDFGLNKGGKRGRQRDDVAPLEVGDAFPIARHLAYVGGQPALPMGWVKVNLQ